MLLLLLVAPTLRGQNSGSSKRDSTVFIYVDTAPLLFLLRLFLFFSLFLGCLYAFSVLPFPFLRRSARDCETSFSDTIPYRRDYLLTGLFLPALLSFFFSFTLLLSNYAASFLSFYVYSLRRNELRYSAKLVCISVHHRSDTKAPLNNSSWVDWDKW